MNKRLLMEIDSLQTQRRLLREENQELKAQLQRIRQLINNMEGDYWNEDNAPLCIEKIEAILDE